MGVPLSAEPNPLPPRASDRVRLLAADPELAAGIPADELDVATRVLAVDLRRVSSGPWEPDLRCADGTDAFALLLLGGAITREVSLGDRRSAELFGPGDIVRAARPEDSLVPHEVHWTVSEPGAVALLDGRFRAAARRWPSLADAISARLLDQTERLGLHLAVAQLGRVEQRLLAMLWHLADRWGRVTPDGVTIPLKLTHEALGRLVGAQRPTVTLALAELGNAGCVTRAATGGWLLQHGSRARLEGHGAADTLGTAAANGAAAPA
jgi:CRP-like cAMP-binding protein